MSYVFQFRLKTLLIAVIVIGTMMWLNFYPIIMSPIEGNNRTGILYGSGFPLPAKLWFDWSWEHVPEGTSPKSPARVLENGDLEVKIVNKQSSVEDKLILLKPLQRGHQADFFSEPILGPMNFRMVIWAGIIFDVLLATLIVVSAAITVEWAERTTSERTPLELQIWFQVVFVLLAMMTASWLMLVFASNDWQRSRTSLLVGPFGRHELDCLYGLIPLGLSMLFGAGIVWNLRRAAMIQNKS